MSEGKIDIDEVKRMINSLEKEWEKETNNDYLTYINGQLKSLYYIEKMIKKL
jgi:hypothetical protein